MNLFKGYLLLITMAILLPIATIAQEHPRASVRSVRSMVLFEGIENKIDIELRNIKERQVDVTCSDSRAVMQRLGNDGSVIHYAIVPASIGELTIKVEATINDMDYDLGYRTFKVQHLPVPLLMWCGSICGENVSRRQLCDTLEARIPGDFFNDVHFEIHSFRLTIGKGAPMTAKGCVLSNEMKKALSKAPKDTQVVIDQVVTSSPKGDDIELGGQFFLN